MSRPSPDPSLVQAVLTPIRAHPVIRLAILFGSLAGGTARADSDVDLAVDAGRCLTADEKMTLIAELAGSTGRPVDLIDIHAIGEPLLGQILRRGTRIPGSDADYAALIRRHVFDQADFLPYRNRNLAERRRAWLGK